MTTKEEILEEIKDINYAYNNCSKYETIKNLLDEMTEERKKGKWICHDAKEGYLIAKYSCSVCNYYSGTRRTNFCPNCGADMRGEKDG